MTLKELRIQSGKTQQQIASSLNVSRQSVGHYENGLRKIDIEQVMLLAKVLECSAAEVIEAQINSCLKALQGNRE